MMALDSLAAYYVSKAKKERDKEAKKEYFSKVSFKCFTKLWMILRKKCMLMEFVTACTCMLLIIFSGPKLRVEYLSE